MYSNYIFPDVTSALPALLSELADAPTVGSRVGRTKELTHVGITLDYPLRREVLVPGRRCNIVAQIAETVWVLAGRNDVEWLSRYLPRARDYSDDGKVWRGAYGRRLRKWHGADQLTAVVEALQEDPETRRAVAVIYDPEQDFEPGKDIPCNNWLSFLIRDGRLDLHVAVRSNDAMWGWSGINTFEWSVVQEIVAGMVGVEVGALHFSTTSFHLYEKHWDRAKKITQEAWSTERPAVTPSPSFEGQGMTMPLLDAMLARWFQLEEKIRNGENTYLAIGEFPDPMLRSWLRVLDWWWNGAFGNGLLIPIRGTALEAACLMGLQPPWARDATGERHDELARHIEIHSSNSETVYQGLSPFLQHAIKTHNEKHEAYGDSWKRRGEMLGIMANIARKVDRLGGSETADETLADTAMDLMIYLAKYRTWLDDVAGKEVPGEKDRMVLFSDKPEFADALLVEAERLLGARWIPRPDAEEWLKDQFDRLETAVVNQSNTRVGIAQSMLQEAYALARQLYEIGQDYQAVFKSNFGQDYKGADHE